MEAIYPWKSISMRTRSAPTHMRSMLQQGQAALLVLAFVVGQVGSFVHAAFERHTVCSEHGEIVHVPHGMPEHGHVAPGTPALADEHARAPRDLDAIRDGAAAGDEHAHEHCYLCPASREPLTPRPSGDALAAVMPAAVAFALPAVVATSDRARYIIAPKTSPPV
jgi:hypothetical protein